MADSIGSRILARIYKSVSGVDPDGRGHGPYSEANDGWVDSKPYVSHWRQGLFEGYDGSLWLYMAFPKDVQIRWLPNDWEKIENQSFFVDMCKDLASMFSSQEDKLKNDLRRDIHIQVTQEPSKGIVPPENDTPAHADYLRRIAANYTKPVWRSFIGVKLIEGSLFDRAYSIKDTIRRYIDSFTEIELLRANAFISDLNHVHDIMLKHGFTDIDFVEDSEALERLTAWHGVSDEQFSMRRQLQDQKLHVPVHGRSIITPRWGELYMSALRPSESLDYVDPMSNAKSTRWATPLLSPSSDVVAISIRAQIRADDVIDNMLDMKNSNKNKDSGTGKGSLSYGDLIFAARESVTRNHIPMLDNTEIIIASKVPKARTAETALEKMFAKSGMDIALLHGRQDTALLSTLPTYPRHVMSIPRGNAKRPHLSNALMPGVIAFSTLFQSSRPLAPGGIMVGLGDDKSSYPEIMIELDAASRLNGTPVWLVSGRPGAGKTQGMLQFAIQAVMQGDFVAYYNPKQTGTLKPVFDYMGGVTISMKRSYLQDNPGLADPFFFLEEREAIANVISDAVITSMKMTSDHGSSSAARRTSVSARIKDRCLDPRYRSTREVLLGNGSTLPPLEDAEVVKFVKDKEKVSPFWSSFMAPPNAASVISTRLKNAKAILFEWDDSMALPPADKRPEDYTDNETDTMLSLVTMFQYSVARARAIGKQSMIICDEAHVLKGSSEAMNTINRAGREWRQANINLILGTQEMKDFLGSPAENGESEMASFIGRYIIMAIAPESRSDLEWFFRISKLPKDSEDPKNISANTYARYIINAGADSAKSSGGSKIVRAYMVDHIYGWSGGIIVGPWPKRELDLGRTDKGAEEERRRMGLNKTFQQILDDKESQEEDLSVMRSNGSYGGFLAGVITQESDEDSDEDGNSDVN